MTDTAEELQEEVTRLRRALAEKDAKVIDVATKYAKAHGLCETVDQALNEMGVFGSSVTQTLTIDLRVNVTADLPAALVEAMDAEALAEFLKEKVTPDVTFTGDFTTIRGVAYGKLSRSTPRVRVADWEISDMSDPEPVPDYTLHYTSREGRKAHVIPNGGRHGYAYALCGAYVEMDWSANDRVPDGARLTDDHEPRVCNACASKAETRYGVQLPI
jgi:hypothetical protein